MNVVKIDYRKAFELLEKGHKARVTGCAWLLARAYRFGCGVAADKWKAAELATPEVLVDPFAAIEPAIRVPTMRAMPFVKQAVLKLAEMAAKDDPFAQY